MRSFFFQPGPLYLSGTNVWPQSVSYLHMASVSIHVKRHEMASLMNLSTNTSRDAPKKKFGISFEGYLSKIQKLIRASSVGASF